MQIIMRKTVVASDSFKGCLSSAQVADAVEKGIHELYPDCEIVKLAVADGGEGTMEALGYRFMDADLKKGADMVLDVIGFDHAIEEADLVITGEGKIDGQTLNGKH